MEGAAAKSYFPYSVWKKSCHLWWSRPPLQLSMSFNSIPHFNTFRFSPWSKNNPSNQPRELGLYPSRGRILCPHVRYSNGNILSSDIEIKWYKSTNSSMRLGLKLWCKSQSEIKSFYRTKSSSNLVGRKGISGSNSKNWRMLRILIWLRVWTKNKNHKN